MSTSSATNPVKPRHPVFATTHWSVVQTDGRHDTSRSGAALKKLCRTYWYPLCACARRRGQSPADAQDMDAMAPVVIKTLPEAGPKDVAPRQNGNQNRLFFVFQTKAN